ncbi:MAG TPA: hypothetical protein VL737_03120 [Candidatus Pristimantibacillus sp.]|jgi:hypothetical protein|nr:hypothetical protein [Candidatus Pristimantibacillus sp.]
MIKQARPNTSVDDIQVIDNSRFMEVGGRWRAKSGGFLTVQFALPKEVIGALLDYDNPAFDQVEEESGVDIRGLRSYQVEGIPQGSIGGQEWHRARTEYVTALAGSALWQCVDPSGREREFVLDGRTAVLQPPGILHTYEALEDDTRLEVVCNTLFIPDNKKTHDTFPAAEFAQPRTA